MDPLNIYAHLFDRAESVENARFPSALHIYLQDLADFDRSLDTEAAWRLDSRIAQKLADETGHAPPGGWSKFVNLVAGTRWVKTQRERFIVQGVPDADENLRQELVEAYTQQLVPPTVASSTFILLGIHPAWGVYLANKMSRTSASSTKRKDDLFPEATLDVVTRCVYGAIGTVMEALAEVGAEGALSRPAFAKFAQAAIDWTAGRTRDRAPETVGGLDPFLDRTGGEMDRIGPLWAQELIAEVLVPAGAAKTIGDDLILVDVELLQSIDVGPDKMTAGRLDDFLSDSGMKARA